MVQSPIPLELPQPLEACAQSLAAHQQAAPLQQAMQGLVCQQADGTQVSMILGRAMSLAKEPLSMTLLRREYCRALLRNGCEYPELVAKSLGTATARCVELLGGCLRCALKEAAADLPLSQEQYHAMTHAAAVRSGIKVLESSGVAN